MNVAYAGWRACTSARGASCASAGPSPGQSCELTITIKGPDGKAHEMPAAWRFDEVDGKLAIVGGVAR